MSERYTFYISIIVIAMISCNSKKSLFDPNDVKYDYISFGSGGGFTGHVSKYFLTEEGDIYVESDSTYTKLTSVSKNLSSQLFKNYTELGLDRMILDDPGNKYYFIQRNSKGVNQILKWGKNPLQNKIIDTYFNILMKPVKETMTSSK